MCDCTDDILISQYHQECVAVIIFVKICSSCKIDLPVEEFELYEELNLKSDLIKKFSDFLEDSPLSESVLTDIATTSFKNWSV
jgi:hypothetical protein